MMEEGVVKVVKPVVNEVKKVISPSTSEAGVGFGNAFKYPFRRMKGMLNFLWILIPLLGIFIFYGYLTRIVKEFSAGKFEQLPEGSFGGDLKLGFFMFLKSIPFILAYGIIIFVLGLVSPWAGMAANFLISILVTPILTVNFMNKETIGSYFEFKIVGAVFKNLGDYLIAFLKTIGLAIIFLIMFIVLVGIPSLYFTTYIFMADFYRRNVKESIVPVAPVK